MAQSQRRVRRLSLGDIKDELRLLEEKFGWTSAEFRKRYRSGELDGTSEFVRWIGLCRMLAAAESPVTRD